jgi:cystathionine beta-lyase
VWGLGHCAGTEEAYLGLRGIRTMALRLERSAASGLLVAQWMQHRKEVAQVHFPPLPEDPGHALWKRDFTGSCGLFSLSLAEPYPVRAVAAMVEGYRYFGLGASWGGYESLVLPAFPERLRTAAPWRGPGPVVRYYIGLEEPADLIADLEEGFDRLTKAAG